MDDALSGLRQIVKRKAYNHRICLKLIEPILGVFMA
jgi:hypothetical protein